MNTDDNHYFDLHVTGIGYLSRVREVEAKRGGKFVAVDISALHGSVDDVQYTRFDCRVSGTEAQKVIRRITPHLAVDKKVLVGFKLGDLYPELFTYKSGERQGETGVSLKARLLRITWVNIDGKKVYPAPSQSASDSKEPQAA